ncbi:MAG TPA: DUF262 domain-containing protein [Dehalococcoidia bacterium]|nr:DUF262 domain-containing protein [Dehalococcoidia bacterium]
MSQEFSFLNQRLQWIGLGDLLRSHLLKVPPHQRSYAWTKAEVEDFWEDLSREKDEGGGEYFMGPIIITSAKPPDPRLTIIDGQQRLATASIMIAVLVSSLIRIGDTDTAQDIERDYLGHKDLRRRTLTPRLILNEEDKQFFTAVVSREKIEEPTTGESKRRIYYAYKYFTDLVEQQRSSSKEQSSFRDWVIDWIEYVREKAIIMLAVIPEESDAFAIFETLNARGRELAIADLLKNHLFSCAGESMDDVRRLWNSASSKIGEVDETAITDFLRHYWNSRYTLARERELYRRFRSQIHDGNDSLIFAEELDKAASDYSALLNPGHMIWRELGQKVVDAVFSLFGLRLEQNRPMLLAAMRKLQKSELAILLPWLLSWSVRGVMVGGIGKGKYEVNYANAAIAINNDETSSVTQIFDKIENIIPSDTEFEIAFRTYRPSNNRLTHYILRALEMGAQNEIEPYVIPNPDHQELTLEHVLPRNPNRAEWPTFLTDEIIAEYVPRLGNLALVPRILNKSLGNRPFNSKRTVYLDADLKLTKDIANEQDWSPEVIERRQNELAKLALKVWPRIPSV